MSQGTYKALLAIGGLTAIGLLMRSSKVEKKSESSADMRDIIIQIAANELGPQDANKYWEVVQPSLVNTSADWCGAFALWVLNQAGIADNIPWIPGKGFISEIGLPMTNSPKAGDIAYFHKNQHHAIVERVNGNQVHTIDGNQANDAVAKRVRPLSEVAGFFSIEPLLRGQL